MVELGRPLGWMGVLCWGDAGVDVDDGGGYVKPLQSQRQSQRLHASVPLCCPNFRAIRDADAVTAGHPSAVLPTAVGQTSYDRLLAEPGLKETGQTGSH